MTEKTPPRPPFRRSRERPLLRPNPGGRRPGAPLQSPAPTPRPQDNLGRPQPVTPQATPYVPPSPPENANPDAWIATPEASAPQPVPQGRAPEIRIEELVAANENPILRSAGPLLLLLGRLRVA